ncbi:hypothetical protein BX070DRAFT_220244 [Coemansia spiralis]|nr:hypothetical protein BX070DRAFT_220244 [Coemansia spiralis]
MSLDPSTVPFLRSCERCRQKKRKCTGDRPSCVWCRDHDVPCRYRRSMRFKKQLKDSSPSSIDALRVPVVFSKDGSTRAANFSSSMYGGWSGGGAVPMEQQNSSSETAAKVGPLSSAAPVSMANASNTLLPAVTPRSQAQQPLGQLSPMIDGNSFSADTIARLLSVDMIPQSNPPPNLVQAANSFMTPFAGSVPFSGPEWTAMSNTEASMLANLGDLATSGQLNSPQEWMPVGFHDSNADFSNSGNIAQNFLNSELMFNMDSGFASQGLQGMQSLLTTRENALPSDASLGTTNSIAKRSAPSLPTDAVASVRKATGPIAPPNAFYPYRQSLGSGTFSTKSSSSNEGQSGMQRSTVDSSKQDKEPTDKGFFHTNFGPPLPVSPIYGVYDAKPQFPASSSKQQSHSLSMSANSSPQTITCANTDSERANLHRQQQVVNRVSSPTDNSPVNPQPLAPALQSNENVADRPKVPSLLKEYVAQIPGNPSPEAIYKIMRETFKAPRMGMVSLNIELIWYMLHKGVLPRIAFYGHISSTIRCSLSNLDIKSMVPPNIDENCYELALKEAPLVKDCSEIWGAIGLCMLARYEFQSLRYKEMAEHADMAMLVMRRIKYMGHSYPWHNVQDKDKESFGFQYLLAIFWKSFLWKQISLMLIEHGEPLEHGLDQLPAYSSKTFDLYTADQPYDVDLMEMLPRNSWSGADSESPPVIRFQGPSDKEFMRMRPEESPCFNRESKSAAYVQQLLVVFAAFFHLLAKAKHGEIGLEHILKGLWAFKERMRVWRYSLPPELVLDNGLVSEYLEVISPSSTASHRDIDIKASQLKDIIMMLMIYHTFLARANRYVMKMMLGERIDLPPPDINTAAFGIRDLYDCTTSPQIVAEGLGHMNMYFHGCRIQAIKSANALCSLVQAAYMCKFNFYTLGSTKVFTIFEILVVYLSFLRNRDKNIAWRSKSRLSNVFNILRMLRHWAPALHLFVAGIKALSDPQLCLEEPHNFGAFKRDIMDPAMLDMADSPVDSAGVSEDEGRFSMLPPKRRRVVRLPQALESTNDARTNIFTSNVPHGATMRSGLKRDETLSYKAADPIPEFPNPFPRKHIISLIIKDLGLSLAEFLAPAYPILLLKLMPANAMFVSSPSPSTLLAGSNDRQFPSGQLQPPLL